MVNRSISNKSFLGGLCLSPSPSNPVSVFMILLSSSSSGVVRNVSESLLGSTGAALSAVTVGWEMSDARDIPTPSAVGSAGEGDERNYQQKNTFMWNFIEPFINRDMTEGDEQPWCGAVWTCFVRWALEFARLEATEGGGSKSFSSMLASFTNMQDVPRRTILFSTFRVIILHKDTFKVGNRWHILTEKSKNM